MMTRRPLILLLLSLPGMAIADGPPPWERRQLESDFFAEGSAVGDIDGDEQPDLVYGPFWFRGPEFTEKHALYPAVPFEVTTYSDNFFSHVIDANRDGRNDVLVYGFPGRGARLYLNPGKEKWNAHWPMHVIADRVGHESPEFIDLIPGGLPEIVCSRETSYGFYQAGDDPTQAWTWHAISVEGEAAKPFGHGMGVGDVNRDGRLDVIERNHWYEHPKDDAPWKRHRWAEVDYGGGAQILVYDVDGDGDSDLITSLQAHGYGLAWFEQVTPGKFTRHDIMGQRSTDNPYGVCFTQPHALALADIDGDGVQDVVTGKRWYAHNSHDVGGLQAAVLYWFRCVRTTNGVEFVPHLVDEDSGVGVGVTVTDLNNDNRLDIVSANKKGLTIHLQGAHLDSTALQPWKTASSRPQDQYGSNLTPAEALKRMEVPEGFAVDLIASEPEVVQPIAMCFDARGRIWVVEGLSYPQPRPEGQGLDRIVIFEDADANGSFESRKVFAEGISLASGIEVGFGGVWVGAAPYFLFIPDRDQDDVPDGKPEILLDGWGHQDTHETLNAFTWGPDGWLYGCHGVFTHSKVGKPGTPDAERIPLNAGVWRYHPIDHKFEVFSQGTSNPWGVDFNEVGDFFLSACVIPHFYHMIQGGRYIRQGGQHFNPYTFGEIDTIADHAHYTGNIRDHAFWGSKPIAPADTSALGGGHAHCGLAIYQADEFPPAYRGDAFFHNLHGHRIVREELEHVGSGYLARHRPDFVYSNSHDFIGVGVMLGPDGALYYSDWVDPQTCHHRDVEIWDRSNGRLYRVRYGDAKPYRFDLNKESDAELVERLASPNAFFARQAQRILQERSAPDPSDQRALRDTLKAFEKKHTSDLTLRLRAIWTLHCCRLLSKDDLLAHLADSNEYVRGWAVQFLGEQQAMLPTDVITVLEEMAAKENSLVTRRYLASLLQRLAPEQRWKIAAGLIRDPISPQDQNIPLLCWYGIEPLVEKDPARAMALASEAKWPQLREFIARRITGTESGRTALLSSLATAQNTEVYLQGAKQLLAALAKLPPVDPPGAWPAARARGEKLNNPAVTDVLHRLGARFGDAKSFPHWRTVARNGTLPPAQRVAALEFLLAGNDPELGALARELIGVAPLRSVLVAALRADPGIATAEALVPRLGDFSLKLRNDAINLLASREDMALILLKAVDAKEVDSSLVSVVLLDQFERFQNKEIAALITRHWSRGTGGLDLAQLRPAIESWKKKLNPKALAKADASRGRDVYEKTCGTCHQLFGEGIALGPDLTGSNRADLGYLLENVLAPSAVVGKDYLLHIFTMKDKSVVSGVIREQTPEFIKVAMPGGSTADVKVADIATRQELAQSLMPPGLFDALEPAEVADLVKYLGSPNQVPLSRDKPKVPANNTVAPPAKGVTRIEGEALLKTTKVSSGSLQDQPMSGFGPGWSGDRHLWWTGAKPGATLTLTLPKLPPGTHDLTIFPTTAKDYGQIKVTVNGQIQSADLFTEKVLPGAPLVFKKVNVSAGEPLKVVIEITGANPAAVASYMVGLDRLELRKAQ